VTNLGLVATVSASYVGSLLVYERLRRVTGRARGFPPKTLRRAHQQAVFAPLLRLLPEPLVGPLDAVGRLAAAGQLVEARARWAALVAMPPAPLPEPARPWVEAALLLGEAEHARDPWRRYVLAARARWSAHLAARLSPNSAAPRYLWLNASLGYLVDPLNLELVLLHSHWVLRRAFAACGPDPLLYLASAQRAAVAGQSGDVADALARALYYGRGDRFIALVIVELPSVGELAPRLAEQAAAALRTRGG
jgi:hypothetical protein